MPLTDGRVQNWFNTMNLVVQMSITCTHAFVLQADNIHKNLQALRSTIYRKELIPQNFEDVERKFLFYRE